MTEAAAGTTTGKFAKFFDTMREGLPERTDANRKFIAKAGGKCFELITQPSVLDQFIAHSARVSFIIDRGDGRVSGPKFIFPVGREF